MPQLEPCAQQSAYVCNGLKVITDLMKVRQRLSVTTQLLAQLQLRKTVINSHIMVQAENTQKYFFFSVNFYQIR